jgi:hypothetical protein
MNVISRMRNRWTCFTLSAIAALSFTATSRAEDEFGKRATWSQPTAAQVKADVDRWLAPKQLDANAKAKIDALWADSHERKPDDRLLDVLAETIAVVEEPARSLVEMCREPRSSVLLPPFAILTDEKAPALVRNNLRLLYGRWLARERLYDESLLQIADLKAEEVVDPTSLLFYQCVGHHWLLDKKQCLPKIERLLENKETIPHRYATMASLMEADLKPLKEDSLDEIGRMMNDIGRRLDLGRAGKKVIKKEDDVIAKLDKMIEELEKQQQQQQQQQAGGSNPSSPMPDSMPGGGSGPGQTDPKKIGEKSNWGNLPPKEREEMNERLREAFPPYYRDVIEEYFRKLARDGVDK